MINETYKSMLGAKSVIRELSEYATARGKEIGYENVFDFSLGNPSVAVPQEFTDEMIRLLQTEDTMTLHGYTPSLGNPLYKEKIAQSLNKRFGMNYGPEHIFPTTGQQVQSHMQSEQSQSPETRHLHLHHFSLSTIRT